MAKTTTRKAPARKAAPKIAAAAMTAGGSGGQGLRLSASRIEDAMAKAVSDALAKGITDDAEILKRKLAARERVKADFAKEEAKALREAQRASKRTS